MKKLNIHHKELVTIIYHLIVAIAVFAVVYAFNNYTNAQNSSLTIINETPVVTTTLPPVTYEDLSNMSYQLVLTHIKIAASKGNLDVLKLNIDNNILETINDAENLVRENIIENLRIRSDKTTTFTTYFQDMESTLSKGDFFIMILGQDISTRTIQMNTCIKEKSVTDQEYFKSIEYYDQQGMITALRKSTTYNACIAQTRLEINAKTAIVSKLKFYYDLLKTKYDFLSTKQEAILNNVKVLDATILEELNSINTTLDAYNF